MRLNGASESTIKIANEIWFIYKVSIGKIRRIRKSEKMKKMLCDFNSFLKYIVFINECDQFGPPYS